METLFQKIYCTNREHFNTAVNVVLEELGKVVEDNKNLNDQDKKRFKESLAEHYKKLLSKNVTFMDDQDEHEETARKDYLNNKLLPKLNDVLIETTRKRKHCPWKCSETLEKRLKLEKEKLMPTSYDLCQIFFDDKKLQRYEANDDREKALVQNLSEKSLEIFENKMKAVSSEINNYIQTVQGKIDKAKNYTECLAMAQKVKTCRTDQVIFEEIAQNSKQQ